MVTGNTYRNPALLAKLAVTVDHLSGGRLEFGIGAAWASIEHSMYGIEGLEHRVGRLSESLKIIKSLWTEERTNFDGRYYQMKDAIANPKPIQKPHPPIWIGASGETTIRLVARYADVWNTGTTEIDKGIGVITRLEDACGAVGRNPSEIRRSIQLAWDGQDRSRLLEQSARYFELGFTEQVFMLDPPKATMLAGKLAEALSDLRAVERVRK
jgi:alkanesulfonate monooxygenase SsuD/methylene tetrahydromethanopterin reductase-like flavin-dependent oxidoreductase (luciferase family)